MEGVYCVDVRVHKPQAPLHVEFKDVTVTIRRDIRTGGAVGRQAHRFLCGHAGRPARLGRPSARLATNSTSAPCGPVPVLLALGGNVGDVEQTLRAAVDELSRVTGSTWSPPPPCERRRPWAARRSPTTSTRWCAFETTCRRASCLGACQGIEMVHGRERNEVNGPRTLDIDIIDFDGAEGDREGPRRCRTRAPTSARLCSCRGRTWSPMPRLPGAGPIAPLAIRMADR